MEEMRLARRREWIEKRMMIDQNVIKHRPAAGETLHRLKKENKDKGYELKILHSGNKKIVVKVLKEEIRGQEVEEYYLITSSSKTETINNTDQEHEEQLGKNCDECDTENDTENDKQSDTANKTGNGEEYTAANGTKQREETVTANEIGHFEECDTLRCADQSEKYETTNEEEISEESDPANNKENSKDPETTKETKNNEGSHGAHRIDNGERYKTINNAKNKKDSDTGNDTESSKQSETRNDTENSEESDTKNNSENSAESDIVDYIENSEIECREYQNIMAERAAEEKLKKEAKERERISMLEKRVEEQIKLQNLSVDNGKLDIMMIKEIRKRIYLKADQEKRLALIKDDMGALRPSLFANVPPFLRFVPPNSLFVPPKSRRGRGVKGRILPDGMEKMGWYDVVSCLIN